MNKKVLALVGLGLLSVSLTEIAAMKRPLPKFSVPGIKELSPEQKMRNLENEQKRAYDQLVEEADFVLTQKMADLNISFGIMQAYKLFGIDVGVVTKQHSNRSKTAGIFGNEDRFDIRCQKGVCSFGVYDGHGGYGCSAGAREQLLPMISKALERCDNPEDCQNVVKKAYKDLDEQVGQSSESGATASTVTLRGNELIVAHVGDSRVVVCKAGDRPEILYQTTDHSADLASEQERITQAGGYVSGRRLGGTLALSRALGDYHTLFNKDKKDKLDGLSAEPEVQQIAADACDFVIVASDGFWDKCSSEDAARYVHAELIKGVDVSAQQLADRLLNTNWDGHDDVTVMIILLHRNVHATHSPVSSENGGTSLSSSSASE